MFSVNLLLAQSVNFTRDLLKQEKGLSNKIIRQICGRKNYLPQIFRLETIFHAQTRDKM